MSVSFLFLTLLVSRYYEQHQLLELSMHIIRTDIYYIYFLLTQSLIAFFIFLAHMLGYSFLSLNFLVKFQFQKTKPTQHSVRGLRGLGLTPNILACRSTKVHSSTFFPQIWFTGHILHEAAVITNFLNFICHWQALDENVKAKLAQFCHVPVTIALLH